MQEFLSGSEFEKMAREYNAKYNSAEVLTSESNFGLKVTDEVKEEKEKFKTEIKRDFEEVISLFLFIKKYIDIKSFGFSGGKVFCSKKMEEIERKIKNLMYKVDEILKWNRLYYSILYYLIFC